jgi:hypothetical protein
MVQCSGMKCIFLQHMSAEAMGHTAYSLLILLGKLSLNVPDWFVIPLRALSFPRKICRLILV